MKCSYLLTYLGDQQEESIRQTLYFLSDVCLFYFSQSIFIIYEVQYTNKRLKSQHVSLMSGYKNALNKFKLI